MHYIPILKRLPPLSAALVLALALALPGALQAQSAAAGPAEALAAASPGSCLACFNCTINGRVGHRVLGRSPQGSEFGVQGDKAHPCEDEGDCCNPADAGVTNCAGPCNAAAVAAVQALADAAGRNVDAGHLIALVEAAEETGLAVEINHARSAVQMIGCGDSVMAHLGLAPAQLAALEGARQPAVRTLAVAGR